MDVLAAAALGLALGIVTGMPLGVINVAVVDAAAAGDPRRAARIGAGGAIADAIHASVAFAGIGRLVTERPDLVRVLAVVAAVVVVAFAVMGIAKNRAAKGKDMGTTSGTALVAGFLMTLPNPGALGAWVAVAAAVWPQIEIGPAIVLGVCVGIGSTLWFAWLARFTFQKRERPVMRHIPRIALVLLVVLAGVGLATTMVRA